MSGSEESPMETRTLRRLRVSERPVKMKCEWRNCDESFVEYNAFREHVREHSTGDDIEMKNSELSACLWEECGFESRSRVELAIHINYHAYHSRLKSVGVDVRKRYRLQECKRPNDGRNRVPDLPSVYQCGWTDCSLRLYAIQDYFDHVKCHVIGSDPGPDGMIPCEWFGCESRFRKMSNVKDHVRRHTGERNVACDGCGGTFASNAVFEDHCMRQTSTINEHRCETCGKPFSSERLMRNHSRRHINSYKCPFCFATSSSPSGLTKHIRYRHLDYRPFKCQYCTHTSVNALDMRMHTLRHEGITTESEARRKDATDFGRIYACHYCDNSFSNAYSLTKHLIRYHGFDKRTSGFVRLRYELCDDGFHRLMPLRYESLEVSKQIMAEKDDKDVFEDKTLGNMDFKLVKCSEENEENPASFIAVPSYLNDPESIKAIVEFQEKKKKEKLDSKKLARKTPKKMCKNKRARFEADCTNQTVKNERVDVTSIPRIEKESVPIEISIAHVDKDGNVIKSEIIESQEIIV